MSAIPGSQIKKNSTYARFPMTVQSYTSSEINLSDSAINIRGERQWRMTPPNERLVAYDARNWQQWVTD